jgi:hypothetical protein
VPQRRFSPVCEAQYPRNLTGDIAMNLR